MALPLAPTNGQQFTEAANDRKWVYDGVRAAWVPADRVDLNDFDDVNIVAPAPTDLQPLTYDGTLWSSQDATTAGAFVPLLENTVDPVDGMTNVAPAGTVWRNTTTQRAWISQQEADATGLTTHQEALVTNPAGAASYTDGNVWGVNFVPAFNTTINSFGVFLNSWDSTASAVSVKLYDGANGATLLSESNQSAPGVTGTNAWRDVALDKEVSLVSGNTYSVAVTTVNGTHAVGHLATGPLYLSQWDADGNGDATTATMIANNHVMAIRFGYNHESPGTVWWPIAPFTGDGLAALERLATPPAAPVDGQVYYNTTISALFVYDAENANWIQCVN